jgi:hypothetical protein
MAVAIRVKYPKPVRKDAAKDPRFQKLKGQVQGSANKVKQHPPASKKAREAQAAAQGPPNEKIAGAEANKADAMGAAETEKPQPDSFLAALRAEIEKVMPKTLDDADKFMEGGEKEQLKGSVSGSAKEQSDQASAGMKSASDAPPDTGAVPAKPVTPLPGEPAVTAPGVDTGNAVPAPKPADETSLKAGKDAAAASLKEADLDNAQLKKANDPRFSKVLKDKDAVDKNAEAGPQKYRGQEQKVLAQGVAKASGDAKAGLTQLTAVRTKSTGKVKTGQLSAKEKDEKRRKEVTDNIQKIFKETKDAVDGKLNTLETETMSQFDRGMNSALDAMKSGARAEIAKFKEERYSGVTGKGRWVADLFRPVPEEIKRITERHRQNFTKAMDGVAERVAAFVDGRLNAAKADIAKGQARIKTYVASLPKDLQAVGKAAEQDVSAKLDELRQGVEDKKNDLAQKLAQKYKEAQDRADEETKKIQDENKGYLAGLAESIGEVVKLLTEFKAKLMAVLKKGEDAIKLVLKDPIGFLGNLIGAIKLGFTQFVGNILTHLKTGFINWLFGGLAEAGVTPPPDLSLPSILTLVLQVLGLTWPQIRSLAVKKLGERNVEMLEKLVGFLMKIFNAGPAAAWAELKASLSDLKAAAIDALQNWIVTTVIQAAVTKILSMLNPAGAIVQAVIAIYNTVMFIVERIGQIMAVVEAIINSVTAIAQGAIAGAANWIEKALGGLIPVVIGLLARLAGLGKITAKITEFIRKVQGKVRGAIEKVIDKIIASVKKLFKGGKGKGKDGKDKDKKDALDPDAQKRWKRGIAAVKALGAKGRKVPWKQSELDSALSRIKSDNKFKELKASQRGKEWKIHAVMNPDETITVKDEGGEDIEFIVVRGPGGETKVKLTPAGDEVQLKAKMSDLKKQEALVQGLGVDVDTAKRFIKAVAGNKQVGQLLMSFAKEKGGQPPEEYLLGVLRAQYSGMAAVAQPPGRETRSKLVHLGEGKEPLSNVALVFHEQQAGQFTGSFHPESHMMEFNYREGGRRATAAIWARGIVQVDDRGVVVKILHVDPKIPGGAAKLAQWMRQAGWKVQLS